MFNTHLDFIQAGAEVLVTATFATRRNRLKANQIEADKFTLEKKEAKLLRLRRCVENIFLYQQLEERGILEQKVNIQKLQTLERSCLEQNWQNQ